VRRAALLLVLACRSPAPEPPTPRPAIDARPTAREPARAPAREPVPSLAERLEARAVTDDDFARRRLYSWTTPSQVETLRTTRVLLHADASTGGRPSPYSRLVAALAPRDPIAKLLRDDPRLRARRYAWPSPFGTVLGRGPQRYGTALVALELRADALVGRLDPRGQPAFAFVDMTGAAVPLDDVLRDPGRIGAIFHVRVESGMPVPFREYVVCNEAMVERWEVGTESIASQVADDIALLEALATGPFADLPEPETRWPAAPRWAKSVAHTSMVTRWHASLAFDNVRYRPTPANLAAAIEALRGYEPAGAPIDHASQ
jgi:hypothetical protein